MPPALHDSIEIRWGSDQVLFRHGCSSLESTRLVTMASLNQVEAKRACWGERCIQAGYYKKVGCEGSVGHFVVTHGYSQGPSIMPMCETARNGLRLHTNGGCASYVGPACECTPSGCSLRAKHACANNEAHLDERRVDSSVLEKGGMQVRTDRNRPATAGGCGVPGLSPEASGALRLSCTWHRWQPRRFGRCPRCNVRSGA